MNKTKLLLISVVILLLLNFGIIGYLLCTKENKPETRRMPRELIIEKLHFDDNQILEYDKKIKIHQHKIRNLDDSIKNTKNELYQLLNSDTIKKNQKDSLYLKLANYQKSIESTHFDHFLEIKAICNKKQLANFKSLTEELSRLFSHQRRPKRE